MTTHDKHVVFDLACAYTASTQPESLDILGPALRDALLKVWPLELTFESVLGYDPDKSDWSQLRDGDPASDPDDDEHPEFLEGEEAYAAAPVGTVATNGPVSFTRESAGWRGSNTQTLYSALSGRRQVIKWGDR